MPRLCAFGCEPSDVPMHRFPNPKKYPDCFRSWVTLAGGKLDSISDYECYGKKRVCDVHFTDKDKNRNNRITREALPSLHIPGTLGKTAAADTVLPLPSTESENNNIVDEQVHIAEDIGDCDFDVPEVTISSERSAGEPDSTVGNVPCLPVTEHSTEAVNIDPDTSHDLSVAVPNKTYGTTSKRLQSLKQVLQLRLINADGVCDEPIYEVLTDEETEGEVDQTTQDTVQNTSPQKTCTNEEINVQNGTDALPEKKESKYEKYKNKEYWKLKLKHILHSTRFCGICLDAGVKMNAINDEFEIIDNERTYIKTLRDIVDKVFNEAVYQLANSQICNSCTNKLIHAYIFIYNAEEISKILNHHLEELYSKTCYVRNTSLKDSNQTHSKIYNVVIALNNKEISENFDSNAIKIEKPETEETEQDQSSHKRRLKCVSCNMVLPSYRAWKVHERTAHRQKHRCRICLQSYRTQQDLTAHHKTHLKPRCAVCHRTVRDGRLLQHLRERHRHAVHLCPTCNVALYSSRALERHVSEWHGRGSSKCVTCLRSLSQEELESHRCRFQCPECVEVPCVHHEYLMFYREQMLNLSPRAKCVNCRYVCTSKQTLIAHVNRQHLGLQPHSCDNCGHKFYCKYDLNKHVCTSVRLKAHVNVCKYCDKGFGNQYFSKRHEKICEHMRRQFQCDDCPANFDSFKDQTKHRKLKHGKDIFSCNFCDRVFLNNSKRKKHEHQIHSIEKKIADFDCVVCQGKFSSEAALELHLKYHRRDANYSCKVCNTRFDTLQQLKSHKHEHRRSLTACEVCGKVTRQSLFKKHIAAHSAATASCTTCGRTFHNLILLRSHQQLHLKSVPCPRCRKLISSAKLWRHFRNHLIRETLDSKVAAIHDP